VKGSHFLPICLASLDRATTQPSFFYKTTTGLFFMSGLNILSQEA
jgi:hypothetical protein